MTIRSAILRELLHHWWVFFALWLYLASQTPARAEWPYDAVTDITNYVGSKSPGGSGTYVGAAGSSGAIVTCAHLFEGTGVGQVRCYFPATQKTYPARVLGIDFNQDLAMLQINRPEGIRPLKIARIDPQAGPFTAVGFPSYSQGAPNFMVGKLVGQTRGKAFTSTEFHSGYSGGALIDRRGRLVGVTVGNDGVAGLQYYTFDHSRSVSNDALIQFASRWVKVSE